MSASDVSGDQAPTRPFHLVCTASDQVDANRAATICAEVIAALEEDGAWQVQRSEDLPLATGPGLELRVESATDTQLELAPTWIDAQGGRVTQPAVGLRIVDAVLTDARRRDFFRRLIAKSPK